MGKELFIKQLRPYLYLMDEAHEATGYIVVGNEKVCVIDTMNGYNDLHKSSSVDAVRWVSQYGRLCQRT